MQKKIGHANTPDGLAEYKTQAPEVEGGSRHNCEFG